MKQLLLSSILALGMSMTATAQTTIANTVSLPGMAYFTVNTSYPNDYAIIGYHYSLTFADGSVTEGFVKRMFVAATGAPTASWVFVPYDQGKRLVRIQATSVRMSEVTAIVEVPQS